MAVDWLRQGGRAPDGELAPGARGTANPERRGYVRRLLRNRTGAIALMVLIMIVLSAIFAPQLAPDNPNALSSALLQQPSGAHLLGTDAAGRDVLSELLYAGRLSLAGPLVALAVSMALGITGGLIGGYYGGLFDSTLSWVSNLLMAIPGIIVLLAVRAALGSSLWIAMGVFGVLMAPAFYRLVYGTVNAVKHELYVDAARVAGISDFRIITRHVFRVVRAPIIIQAAMVAAIAIAIEAALDFLGLGNVTSLTWGNMLNQAFNSLYSDRDLIIWPVVMIALTCVSLVLLANAMRDALGETGTEPKRRRAGRGASEPEPLPVSAQAATPVIAHESPAEPNAGKPLLDIRDLTVGYPTVDGGVQLVVDGVSLSVRKGEVHGLVGESGSGKTQTAFAILGVLPEGGRIVGGEINFDGTDLIGAGERVLSGLRGKRIAYVPQEPMSNLDPSFTVGSQLVEPLRVCLQMSRREAIARALELLERVGISDPRRAFKAYPHEISGGMAQRVLIAGAVSCSPDLLIADEPTTALDVTVQAEVLDLLRDLQQETRMGMILVTHNFGVVADICDRVSVMQYGRIVESGAVRSVFAMPKHPYTRALFDAIVGKDEPDISLEDLQATATSAPRGA